MSEFSGDLKEIGVGFNCGVEQQERDRFVATGSWTLETCHTEMWTQMEGTNESHIYLAFFFFSNLGRVVHCAVHGRLLLVPKDV